MILQDTDAVQEMLWGKDGGFAVVTDLTTTLINPKTLLSQVRPHANLANRLAHLYRKWLGNKLRSNSIILKYYTHTQSLQTPKICLIRSMKLVKSISARNKYVLSIHIASVI